MAQPEQNYEFASFTPDQAKQMLGGENLDDYYRNTLNWLILSVKSLQHWRTVMTAEGDALTAAVDKIQTDVSAVATEQQTMLTELNDLISKSGASQANIATMLAQTARLADSATKLEAVAATPIPPETPPAPAKK